MRGFLKILACMAILSVVLLSFAGCGDDNGAETVRNGDTVIIDFVGMFDGVPFDGGSAENFELAIGSGMFIPGFEEQIIGMRVGEVRDIEVAFPEDYGFDLGGRLAVFRITLHDIISMRLEELEGGEIIGDGQMAENGDVVVIDFVGMFDGVPFTGGSSNDFRFEIGSGGFIPEPGFEEQIIGMRVGGVRDINITFPEEYGPELGGRNAVFRITLHSIIEMTEQSGSFIIELYPEYAPLTVENFVNLVEQEFYNGLRFHRIVDGFMAQGGCPYGQGFGGSGENIICETTDNGWEQNTLRHTRGVLSMAHAGTNTGSSQFFIMFGDAPTLDGRHAAFGMVTEGMEVVEALQAVERTWGGDGAISSPIRPVTIKSMTLIEPSENGNPRVQAEIQWFIAEN